jgi:hypothetical protein
MDVPGSSWRVSFPLLGIFGARSTGIHRAYTSYVIEYGMGNVPLSGEAFGQDLPRVETNEHDMIEW